MTTMKETLASPEQRTSKGPRGDDGKHKTQNPAVSGWSRDLHAADGAADTVCRTT